MPASASKTDRRASRRVRPARPCASGLDGTLISSRNAADDPSRDIALCGATLPLDWTRADCGVWWAVCHSRRNVPRQRRYLARIRARIRGGPNGRLAFLNWDSQATIWLRIRFRTRLDFRAYLPGCRCRGGRDPTQRRAVSLERTYARVR